MTERLHTRADMSALCWKAAGYGSPLLLWGAVASSNVHSFIASETEDLNGYHQSHN